MDALDQVGGAVLQALRTYFGEEHNRGVVDRLAAELTIREAERPKTDTAVAGKTVVFTGALERMTRDEAKARRSAWEPRCPVRSRKRPIWWWRDPARARS
jgi:DNA ligase (NAD+)